MTGNADTLQIDYAMSKEFLPYSWLSVKVPKGNLNYQAYASEHPAPSDGSTDGTIAPQPFFTTVSNESVTLTCKDSGGNTVSSATS